MNNFHFNPSSNRSVHLMKQYEQMTRQLQEKKKLLEKKNLQLEFYEDPQYVNKRPSQREILVPDTNNAKNAISQDKLQNNSQKNNVYENLADQIMNDLLTDNKSKPLPQSQNNPPINMYENVSNFNPPNQFSQKNPTYNNSQPIPQMNPQQPPFVPRQNNFIHQNKRQLQKEKLQNPSSYQQNPFVPKAQPVKRSIQTKQQKPIVNQRQLQKLKLQQQSANQNPFWGQSNKNRSQQKINQNKNQINYQQYENIRQKQKQKLQQQLYQNNGFGSFQRPTSPSQVPAQKDIQSQNISKKAAFQNRYSNPFAKNEDYLKQMREQQQKQYRRALEEQKKIQEERKKNERQKVKEQKYAFNAYEPGAAISGSAKVVGQQNDIPIKSPSLSLTKKVDPNGRPPVYNYDEMQKANLSASQRQYMKMKANELKDNYKKGRILHDQYLSQVKKLAEYYKVDYKELVDRKALGEEEEQLPWIKQKKQQEPIKIQDEIKTKPQPSQRQQNPSQNYQVIQNQQSLERFPESQPSLRYNQYGKQSFEPSRNVSSDQYSANLSNQPYYGQQYSINPTPNMYTQNLSANPQQYGLAATSFLQQMQGVDYDLMRKMFDEMKAMRNDYTKSLQKQKAFLQQTFMKFLASGMMQNQPNQNQSQYQNKSQKASDMSPQRNIKPQQNILTQNSQENLNQQSLEFIEKSLSGVVNKIPFYNNSINRSNMSNNDPSFMMGTPQQNIDKKQVNLKNQKMNKKQQSIQQFFSKPYKCKKFKKFSIMVDVSQSSIQIPNVSNFLALKNGKQVVNKLFEEDLLMMKKLQRQRDLDKLRNRVDNQLSYGNQQSSYGTQQSSSIQQQITASQQVTYGNPPGYANYGQTFNRNQNTGQFNVKAEDNKTLVTEQSNSFEEYENYSRNKERQAKSAHKSHRTYKKADQSVSDSSFLKRHVSGHEQKLPDFADQSDIKARSPVYYSPKLGSEILQQDEYQTAQKSNNQQLLQSQFYGSSAAVKKISSPSAKESTNKKYQMKKKDFAYEQQRQSEKKSKSKDKGLSFKEALKDTELQRQKEGNLGMMKLIAKNNQVLKKYTKSPQTNNEFTPRQEQVDIRQYSSINSNPPREQDLRNYFSNQQKNNSDNYKLPPLVANLKNLSGNSSNQSNPDMERKLSNKFNTQKNDLSIYERHQSVEEIKSQNSMVEDHSEYVSSQQYPTNRNDNLRQYESSQEQTVKSINYSVASSRRPPPSINISQTVQSIEESASRLMRPPLNKKRSTSRKKQSSIIRTKFEKDSILNKPPSSQSQLNSMISENDNDLVVDKEPLKFDSNVYESEYQQSVSQKDLQKRISQLQNEQKMKISQPQINFPPPVIVQNKSSTSNLQGNESKASVIGSNKLKSLQQARNLAKQSKKKSINLNQNDQMFKYEEKLSELESFLTKRQQSIIKQTKEVKTIKLAIQKSPQKKNIMNLLDQLENQSSYKDDFQSYREQSERPRY